MLCRMADKVRVVVGDDHPMFREGVVRALTSSGEIDVVAEADNGADALELIKTHKPQVALLDYRMPQLDGAQVAAAVVRDELPTRVLLVSAHDESAEVPQQKWTSEIAGRWSPGRMCVCLVVGVRLPRSIG